MTEFQYQEMFPLEKDATEYRLLTKDFVSTASFDGLEVVKIDPQALTLLTLHYLSKMKPKSPRVMAIV